MYSPLSSDIRVGYTPYGWCPKACSAQGEYGMIIDSGTVLEWLEENPEAAENDKLSVLKELTDDSNPIVAITVPK